MFTAPPLHPADLAAQSQHFSRAGVARRRERGDCIETDHPASFLEDIF
jgi:hypothetical protein